MSICPKCGLPLQACVCDEITKTEQRIHVRTDKKKFGKIVTIISGFSDVDMKSIAKGLKHELACGGTIRGNEVELQGDHTRSAKSALVKLGFSETLIDIA